jgi:hypothetical protein
MRCDDAGLAKNTYRGIDEEEKTSGDGNCFHKDSLQLSADSVRMSECAN